jgi:hypothetical protein
VNKRPLWQSNQFIYGLFMFIQFLRDVGKVVHDTLENYRPYSRCCLHTKVISIQQVRDASGKFIAWKLILEKVSPMTDCLASVGNLSESTNCDRIVYYARCVLLATGGRQRRPVLQNAAHNSKLMTSDMVCSDQGIAEVGEILKRCAARPVVIGARGVTVAAATSAALSSSTSSSMQNEQQPSLVISPKLSLPLNQSPLPMSKVCIVGGSHSAFSAAWMLLNRLDGDVLNGSGISVCILHRNNIQVFYSTRAEADLDHFDYGDGNGGTVINKTTGQIHPFGGLRGDAKAMWRAVRSGAETRVRM